MKILLGCALGKGQIRNKVKYLKELATLVTYAERNYKAFGVRMKSL